VPRDQQGCLKTIADRCHGLYQIGMDADRLIRWSKHLWWTGHWLTRES